MGYRDDFYMVQYIIGYSGNLHAFPTVYFRKGNEYGHITQKHPCPQNVGRMAVRSSADYWIGSEPGQGTLKLLEKENGVVFHESRSTLPRSMCLPQVRKIRSRCWPSRSTTGTRERNTFPSSARMTST